MTLDVAYSYCTNLTEKEKVEIDKKVRINQLKLQLVLCGPIDFYLQWLQFSSSSEFSRDKKYSKQKILKY